MKSLRANKSTEIIELYCLESLTLSSVISGVLSYHFTTVILWFCDFFFGFFAPQFNLQDLIYEQNLLPYSGWYIRCYSQVYLWFCLLYKRGRKRSAGRHQGLLRLVLLVTDRYFYSLKCHNTYNADINKIVIKHTVTYKYKNTKEVRVSYHPSIS